MCGYYNFRFRICEGMVSLSRNETRRGTAPSPPSSLVLVTEIQQRRVCGAGNEEINQAAAGGPNFNRPWRNSTKSADAVQVRWSRR